jgi:hypothetical protein
MRKSTLRINYDYDFELVGLSSAAKSYKLAWELNEHLQFRLVRQADLNLDFRKGISHTYHQYTFRTAHSLVRLLRNRPNESEDVRYFLVPEYPHFDYLLWMRGEQAIGGNDLAETLRNIPSLSMAAGIPLRGLNSKENLLF